MVFCLLDLSNIGIEWNQKSSTSSNSDIDKSAIDLDCV